MKVPCENPPCKYEEESLEAHAPSVTVRSGRRELRGVALAVITAKVFLVTDLHKDVAVGRKTEE